MKHITLSKAPGSNNTYALVWDDENNSFSLQRAVYYDEPTCENSRMSLEEVEMNTEIATEVIAVMGSLICQAINGRELIGRSQTKKCLDLFFDEMSKEANSSIVREVAAMMKPAVRGVVDAVPPIDANAEHNEKAALWIEYEHGDISETGQIRPLYTCANCSEDALQPHKFCPGCGLRKTGVISHTKYNEWKWIGENNE